MLHKQAADGRVRRRAVFGDVALEAPSDSGESSDAEESQDAAAAFGGGGGANVNSDADSDEGARSSECRGSRGCMIALHPIILFHLVKCNNNNISHHYYALAAPSCCLPELCSGSSDEAAHSNTRSPPIFVQQNSGWHILNIACRPGCRRAGGRPTCLARRGGISHVGRQTCRGTKIPHGLT